MTRRQLWLSLLASLALFACKPEAPLAQAPARPAAPPLAPTPSIARAERGPPEPAPLADSVNRASLRALDSGLSLWLLPRPELPLLHLRLQFRRGHSGDSAATASVVAEQLKQAVARAAETRGVALELDAGSSVDAIWVSLEVEAAELAAALDALSAGVRDRRGAARDFAAARAAAELRRQRASDRQLALDALYSTLFAASAARHRYAQFMPEVDALHALHATDCDRFWQAHLLPANATLLASGAADATRLQAAAERAFTGWRGAPSPSPNLSAALAPAKPKLYLIERSGERATLALGVLVTEPASDRRLPELLALELMRETSAGSAAPDLNLDYQPLRFGGAPALLWAELPVENFAGALDALIHRSAELQTSASSAERLEAAARRRIGELAVEMDSLAGAAGQLGALAAAGLPESADRNAQRPLLATPAETVRQAALISLARERLVIIGVGPRPALAKALTRRGDVDVLDTTSRRLLTRLRYQPAPK